MNIDWNLIIAGELLAAIILFALVLKATSKRR